MSLRTRFEKFYNRHYFIFEYFSNLIEETEFLIRYMIAKVIDSCFSKFHLRLKESRVRVRNNQKWQRIMSFMLFHIRGTMVAMNAMPIIVISHFILCLIGHIKNDKSIVQHGVGKCLVISAILSFLIDCIFSLYHNKYEKYRTEYLREKTTRKVWYFLLFVFMFIANLFLVGFFFASGRSYDIAGYLVSLVQ